MSATLLIREDAVWMPTDWIFDRAIKQVSVLVQALDADLWARLSRSVSPRGLPHCDITALPAPGMKRLAHAVQTTYETNWLAGPGSFHDADQFSYFMWQLSDLKALLRMDQRVESLAGHVLRVSICAQVGWEGPIWIADAAIEHLAAWVSGTDWNEALGLAGAGNHSSATTIVNMAAAARSRPRVREALTFMRQRYGNTTGRDLYAPTYCYQLAELLDAIAAGSSAKRCN
jgi:hypothetical protein